MITIFIRTLAFYFILIASTRVMGKRQMGELQITEFIAVIMLSELAALPIADRDIPPAFGIAPLLTIAGMEIIISFLCRKSTAVRKVVEGKPMILMAKGEIIQKNLTKARISMDEIFAEIRYQGFCDISDINYIILEQTGKMSILPKAKAVAPTAEDLKLSVEDKGMCHTVIIDGAVHKSALKGCGMSEKELDAKVRSMGKEIAGLTYMTVDDEGNVNCK